MFARLQIQYGAGNCKKGYLESLRANLFFFFYQRVQECIKRSEEHLRLNSKINPDNSTSQIGSRAASKSSSRKSRSSSHSGSDSSGTSSLEFQEQVSGAYRRAGS